MGDVKFLLVTHNQGLEVKGYRPLQEGMVFIFIYSAMLLSKQDM